MYNSNLIMAISYIIIFTLISSADSAPKKALNRASFEKILLKNANSDMLATDMAGGWENTYQYVLVARALDRRLYERSLLQIATPEKGQTTGCSAHSDSIAMFSCAANGAADAASSLTLFAAAVEFRRDAVEFAERVASQDPSALADALIGLGTDELKHGRFVGSEEAVLRARKLFEAKPLLATNDRIFQLALLQSKLADARLDGRSALAAFTEAVGVVKPLEPGHDWSDYIHGSHGQQLIDLIASHFRGQFCATCGEPIAPPIKQWIDRVLSGRINEKPSEGASQPEYYLLALSAPDGAFSEAEIKAYARRFLKQYTKQGPQSEIDLRQLPAGIADTQAARILSLSWMLSNSGGISETLNLFRETDRTKKARILFPLLQNSVENSFEQFGSDNSIANFIDKVSRHFQSAGERVLARNSLQYMMDREKKDGAKSFQAEQRKFATTFVPALARLASYDHASGEERSALVHLDRANTLATTKLRDEWTYGGAGAILALRDLAPALRLIAQKRSEIVTARGVSRSAPGHDALFRALQAAMFGETALALAVADQRRFLSDEPLRDLRQRYFQAVAAAERADEIAGYNFDSGDVDGALARTREEAEQRRDALGREFTAKVPAAFASAADIEPVPLAEASARLAEGEALTLLHVGSHGIHGFLLDRTGQSLAWKTTIKQEAVEALVRALRASGDVSQGPFPPFPYADAAKLHDVIFGPVKDRLGGYNRLVIVGDGPLQAMPYGVLLANPIETPPTTREQMRAAGLPWLIRSHALALMPSVRSLVTQRSGASAGQAAKPFLGIGDPKLADASGALRNIDIAGAFGGSNSGLADVAMLRKLVSLPETADELRKIAKLLDAPEDGLLLGNRASEKAIRAMNLSEYKIVAFATHGVLAGQVTGTREPGLVLSPPETASREDDGFLALSEIANLRFDADLVMLSACNTGASDGRPRAEGLSGLARGFFGAGARSLLVTHWEIPSDSSVEITTGLIDERAKRPQADWADAHRAATLAVIDTKGPAEWSHPAYWGGFAVVGVMPIGAGKN